MFTIVCDTLGFLVCQHTLTFFFLKYIILLRLLFPEILVVATFPKGVLSLSPLPLTLLQQVVQLYVLHSPVSKVPTLNVV